MKDEQGVKKLPVMEVFGPTIQGEGAVIGHITTFIRFGLCDYKCVMCDSMFAVDPNSVKANAKWLTPEEIVNELLPYQSTKQYQLRAPWVTFSGGNPTIHDLTELVQRIKELNTSSEIKIAVETQGTLRPRWLHMCDVVTCSPKAPGMGEKFELDKFSEFVQEFQYHQGFNVKVVAFSMADLEWITSINDIMVDMGLGDKMYVSLGNPNPPGKDNDLTKDELRAYLLDEYMLMVEDLLSMPHMSNVKFLPQLHVLTWGNKQGV